MSIRRWVQASLRNTTVTLPPRQFLISRYLWYVIFAIGIVDAVWIGAAGMSVHPKVWFFTLPVTLGGLALGAFYRYVRKDDMIFLFSQVGCQLVIGTLVLAMFSYVTARMNLPLLDEQFVAADHWLLFDWHAWVVWLDQWPVAIRLLTLCYSSCEVQMVILLPLLFFVRHTDHIQRFLIAFLYSGVVVIILSTLFPAAGGYDYYHITPQQLAHVDVVNGAQHLKDFMGMRNHTITQMPFEMKGLVTFPSFHAALALLLVYASLPLRGVVVVSYVINMLMLVSTPANGGHYLVDVLSGLAIAWHSIAVAKRILPESGVKKPDV